jgi:CRP-like cAMP-binding protein
VAGALPPVSDGAVPFSARRVGRDEYRALRRAFVAIIAAELTAVVLTAALKIPLAPAVVLGVATWPVALRLLASTLDSARGLARRVVVAAAFTVWGVACAAASFSPLVRFAGILVVFSAAATLLRAALRVVASTPNRWLARVFPDAPTALLMRLSGRLRWVSFGASEVVVAEGDPTDAFYVVTSGEAEVAQRAGEADVYLRTLVPGDFFGEIGLLRATRRTATVRAIRPLRLIVLDREAFAEVVAASDLTARDLQRVLRIRSARPNVRDDAVPLPAWSRLLKRVFKHPRAMHYNRLVGAVLATNLLLAVAVRSWWSSAGHALSALALLAEANIALAIVFRQQAVINALGRLATRPPPTWPLRIRWLLAKYYHHGGLHVGAALAGTVWYVAFVILLLTDGNARLAARVTALLVVALLLMIVLLAAPPVRARMHDGFEVTHRFCGWAALLLVWISTALLKPDLGALVTSPGVWLLVVATVGVAWPWLRLRRVPITVERPSDHAALVTLVGEATPDLGTTRAISRHPLIGWHQFANVPARPACDGHRMVISRAGDWTAAFIENPPPYVWLRGVPTVELANVWRLFHKVVLVTTGSGIGPALGHLLDREARSRLVWVTRSPRATYGDALVDEILAAQPDATIWNSDEQGKPDVLRLTYGAYLASHAEAVICISNRAVTWQVVHGLERRGIPAFGPIFDS